MKAVRGAELSLDSLSLPRLSKCSDGEVRALLHHCDDERLFVVFEALKRGIPVDEIAEATTIDRWFLHKLRRLAEFERTLAQNGLDDERYAEGKQLGYPDTALERISGEKVRQHLHAGYRMVDTCAAEFEAQTPYFYADYGCVNEAERFLKTT